LSIAFIQAPVSLSTPSASLGDNTTLPLVHKCTQIDLQLLKYSPTTYCWCTNWCSSVRPWQIKLCWHNLSIMVDKINVRIIII